MLYNKDSTIDYNKILDYCDAFCEVSSLEKLSIDTNDLWIAIYNCRRDFPYKHGGEDQASSFKKAAWFLVWFLAFKPIKTTPFTEEHPLFNKDINTIIGLDIAFCIIQQSILYRQDGTSVVVDNIISLSDHSYIDTLEVLSKGMTPNDHYGLISLLLEQITYKCNRHCEYTTCSYYPR